MGSQTDHTMSFRLDNDINQAGTVLRKVYAALREKGYDPASQIVGYLLSGDPTYITTHKQARQLIREIERNELLEELVRTYLAEFGTSN